MTPRAGLSFLTLLLFSPEAPCLAAPWKRHLIDTADPANHRSGADGVRLGDLNGDGRPDLVTGWEEGNQIRVCLQPVAGKVKKPWQAITVGKVGSPEDAVFADLDNDGRLDVVSATEGSERTVFVHWAPQAPGEITDESLWKTAPVSATAGKQWWMYSLPLDVDRDGDIDLIVGSKNTGASVSWLRNPGGTSARDLSKWEATRLAGAGWIMSLELLEQDGERFLVYSDRKGPTSGIYLAPLLKEAPWFGAPIAIGAAGEEVMFLDIAHYDDDSRVDIVAAIRPHTVRVHLQPENLTEAWEKTINYDPVPIDRFGSVKAVRVVKPPLRIDPWSEPRMVVTCENAIGEKAGVIRTSNTTAWESVSGPEGIKFDRIELLDLDEDGDLDIITCEEKAGLGVVWYENPGSPGRFQFKMGAEF